MADWDVHVRRSRGKPRIGPFEVSLVWTHNTFNYKVLIYSKLSSRLWPNVTKMVETLCSILPQSQDQVRVKVVNDSTQQVHHIHTYMI